MDEKKTKETARSKVMTPKEAVQKLIKNGDIIASGGFTVTRKSYAIF
jgi:acyl CoA:acetate/3-ketoacid CoA transferase alpha subunit